MSTFSPTHPHKGLHKKPCDTSHIPFFSILLRLLGSCGSSLVEYMFVTLGFIELFVAIELCGEKFLVCVS